MPKNEKTLADIRRCRRMAQVRAVQLPEGGEEQLLRVAGRAIVFESETELFNLWGVSDREIIHTGSLDEADMTDVPFKYNHSSNVMVMARTRNKTVRLMVSPEGLDIEADLNPNMQCSRDMYAAIERGDIDKMSFVFTSALEEEEWRDEHTLVYHVRKIAKIWDISSVDAPAYKDTSIEARAAGDADVARLQRSLDSVNLMRTKTQLLTY